MLIWRLCLAVVRTRLRQQSCSRLTDLTTQQLGRKELPLHERPAHLPDPARKHTITASHRFHYRDVLTVLLIVADPREERHRAGAPEDRRHWVQLQARRARGVLRLQPLGSKSHRVIALQRWGANIAIIFLQVMTHVWDSNTAFDVVLDDPTKYGFVDATSYGKTGDFWANNFHPSSASTSRLCLCVLPSADRMFVFSLL